MKKDRRDDLEMVYLAFAKPLYYYLLKSAEEIIEYLSSYDVSILWMPLYMGELQKFTEGGWGGGGDSMSLLSQWGLSGAREIDEDYQSGSLAYELDKDSVEESQKMMIQNMQMMLTKNKRLAERLLETDHLQERIDYLNDEGFQAYGAVITGPVKELLKLQEVEEIHSVQLGDIQHWNWGEI